MRSAYLAWAMVTLLPSFLWANPPAGLGVPVGGLDETSLPRLPLTPAEAPPEMVVVTPRGGPSAPEGPALGAPTATLPLRNSPAEPSIPGYPMSYPPAGTSPAGSPPGLPPMLPRGMRLPAGTVPASGMTPLTPTSMTGLADPKASATTVHSSGPCGPIGDCLKPACRDLSELPFRENLSVFFGLDGAKEPVDLGANARFGTRLHINWGIPIIEDLNLGLHLGFGYNYAHNAIRALRLAGASTDINQTFYTLGVFQRTDMGLNWELAWDFRSMDYYEHIDTSQWRGLVSYNLDRCNEVGLWGTYRDRTDRAHLGRQWFNVTPINQINLFWRHTWDNQIVTGLWVGIAEEHGRLLNEPAIQHPFVFGADVFVPLSDRLALWGEANFITPNDTGTVTATLGVAFFPWGRPAAQTRSPFAPPLPAANNTTFSLDAQR